MRPVDIESLFVVLHKNITLNHDKNLFLWIKLQHLNKYSNYTFHMRLHV